jgi:hypothetical protein
VWLHQGSGPSSVSDEAVASCREHGAEVVDVRARRRSAKAPLGSTGSTDADGTSPATSGD